MDAALRGQGRQYQAEEDLGATRVRSRIRASPSGRTGHCGGGWCAGALLWLSTVSLTQAIAREHLAWPLGTLEPLPPPVFSEMGIRCRLPHFSSDLSLNKQ